jgi:thiamine biosynthesis lipoprotein
MAAGLHRVEHVMGTTFSIDVRDADLHPEVLDAVVGWWRWVDRTFSTYRSDSEISRLAGRTLRLADCSAEVAEVLDLCALARRETDGWFDAGYAGGLDPTGLVKGWSLDVASRMLVAAGSAVHCLNGGGDIRCVGRPEASRGWRVAVSDPHDRTRVLAVLDVADAAVATSGTAERGSHVVDPFTGRPTAGVRSVTVLCAEATRADVLATAALAMGDAALPWLGRLPDVEAAVVAPGGRCEATAGLPAYLVPSGSVHGAAESFGSPTNALTAEEPAP